MGDSLNSLVIYIVIAGLIYWAGHQCMKLVNKVDVVHDFTLSHRSDHVSIVKDIQRIDSDVKDIREDFEDVKQQLARFDSKLDKMMSEIKKDHNKISS